MQYIILNTDKPELIDLPFIETKDSPRLDVELYSFLATHNRRRRRLNEEDIKKEATKNRD